MCYGEKCVLLLHEDFGGSQGFAAGSLFQRVTVPENVWDMRPGDFPLPRQHSGIHKVILQDMKSSE